MTVEFRSVQDGYLWCKCRIEHSIGF